MPRYYYHLVLSKPRKEVDLTKYRDIIEDAVKEYFVDPKVIVTEHDYSFETNYDSHTKIYKSKVRNVGRRMGKTPLGQYTRVDKYKSKGKPSVSHKIFKVKPLPKKRLSKPKTSRKKNTKK